jgi:hypothetical protein
MYCPNCGKANSSEQKFCRSCGLNLEDATRSLIEQLPAGEQDQRLLRRKQLVERVLLILGGVGITAFVCLIIGTIITEIIIGKGNVIGGIVFIAFILGMAVGLLLVLYRESLKDATTRRTIPVVEAPSGDPKTRQLTDPHFEPAPSVTDPTTELLAVEKRTGKKDV